MIQRFGVPETGLLAHRTVPALLAPAQLLPGRRRDVQGLLAWGRRPSRSTRWALGRRPQASNASTSLRRPGSNWAGASNAGTVR